MKNIIKTIKETIGGSMCGGVISQTMHMRNMKKYGFWADTMAYVMPDNEYKKYVEYKKAGKSKEVTKLLDKFAHSQI